MWRSPQRNAVNYLLCQMWLGYTDVSTWVSCWCRKWNVVKREYQQLLLFSLFFSFARPPVVKTIWENCSRPLRSRAFQVNIYHVVIHCSSLCASLSNSLCWITAHWVVLVYSPQCLSTIYVENFLLPGYEKGNWTAEFRFPYANHISCDRGKSPQQRNFVFLM